MGTMRDILQSTQDPAAFSYDWRSLRHQGIFWMCPSIENRICSVVWLSRNDPYSSRNRFFADSRAGKPQALGDGLAWEVDYLRVLFPHAHWNWADSPDKLNVLKPDVLVISSNIFHYDKDLFREWAPRILVYLSDEWGQTPDLHRYTSNIQLLLRQYHHPHYVRATNVRQIPLGFMSTMFDDPLAIPASLLATGRRYRWCFVGSMKADRAEALRAFESWTPSFRSPCAPHKLAHALQDSMFVLCPRGNVVMDCFRNYEATVCGAIPVISGCSKREFHAGFGEVSVPPWIYARTWQKARLICEDFVRTNALNDLQQANLNWWKKESEAIDAVIAEALEVPENARKVAVVTRAPLSAVIRWKLGQKWPRVFGSSGMLSR